MVLEQIKVTIRPTHTLLICLSLPQPLEITPTQRIENEDYSTKITITDTAWKNTGVYTLRAENESGFDEATIEITVLGEFIIF